MPETEQRNAKLVLSLCALILGMVLLVCASPSLYNLFCRATGVGGTTQRAAKAPGEVSSRVITVRFNADTDPGLGWKFRPEQANAKVHVGESKLALFYAENESDKTVTGTAVYNVTPAKVGLYFTKIQCFCFTRQTLRPHEKAHFPVSFFVDPGILTDPNMQDVDTITLSYTFFPVKQPGKS
jgi:cytochrome c oxidase assembly protein subunit 11